ncbi:hypothetical protein Tco_1327799 [Tanacetum coccineum]
MRTRSQARRRRQPQVRQTSVESSNLEKPDNPPIVAMADNRTMAQLLEAPTEGYEDAIVIPEITANNFEIKHGLLNLVQNKQFFGNDKEDPHAHIREALSWVSELHQLDTFYNALNSNDQDSLNSAAGGNFLDKMPRECLKIIESKSKVRQSRNKAVVAKMSTSSSTQAGLIDVADSKDMPQIANIYHDNIQEYVFPGRCGPISIKRNSALSTSMVSTKFDLLFISVPESLMPNNQTISIEEITSIKTEETISTKCCETCKNLSSKPAIPNGKLTDMLSNLLLLITASTSGSRTSFPWNTGYQPKEDLKGISNRSGVTFQDRKQLIISSRGQRTRCLSLITGGGWGGGSTEDVQPPVVQIQTRNPNPEPNVAPVVTPVPKASIPFPSRRNDERRKEKASDQIEKFYEIFRDLSFEISFTDALMLMPKFASTLKTLIGNKEKLSELAGLL